MYGAEKVVLTLLKELQNSQYPGILGCIRESENDRLQIAAEAEKDGIPVQYFTMRRGLNLSGLRSILKFVKDQDLDLVHSHGYKPNILLSLLPGRNFKAVSTAHGWAKQSTGIKGKLYEFLDGIALKRMDRVVAVSRAVLDDLKRRGLKKEYIELIYNGIKIDGDTPGFDSLSMRQKYEIPRDAFIIGAVGRLAKAKGHAHLIEAMPAILKEIPHCRLVIAGDGPLRGDLDAMIKRQGLADHIKLLGYVREMGALLAMIDLFALPSLSEGLPIVLLEAMVSEKPIIAASVGGVPEAISDPDLGILVPPENARAIADAVITLSKDKERMARLGNNVGRRVRAAFSAANMAKQYVDLYSNLQRKVV